MAKNYGVNAGEVALLVIVYIFVGCLFLTFSPHSPLYAKSVQKTQVAKVAASDRLADSSRRAARMQRVLAHMDYMEKYKNDRNAFCHHLLGEYESIETDVLPFIDRYGPTDKAPDWHRDLLVDASKFLRYDCWDQFGKDKMGDGRMYLAYERAVRLAWVLE